MSSFLTIGVSSVSNRKKTSYNQYTLKLTVSKRIMALSTANIKIIAGVMIMAITSVFQVVALIMRRRRQRRPSSQSVINRQQNGNLLTILTIEKKTKFPTISDIFTISQPPPSYTSCMGDGSSPVQRIEIPPVHPCRGVTPPPSYKTARKWIDKMP